MNSNFYNLIYYFLEIILYRLSCSKYDKRYILKSNKNENFMVIKKIPAKFC